MTRDMVKIAVALSIVLFTGCGDDDAQPDNDGGADSGSPNNSGGKAGADGGSKGGSGGSQGTGSRPDSGDQEDGGGAAPGSGTDASVDAGSSSGDGGSLDGATADGGMQTAPGCGGLLECCAALPKAERMNCELIANNADDATCDQFKPIVCQFASADGGVVADAKACMTLDDCCDSLPRGPARVACATTVTNGVALDCQQVTQAFCPTGGDPNACTALTECCASQPPPRRNSCTMIVDQGLPAGCETVLTALCP
jgi:hypothetical protein